MQSQQRLNTINNPPERMGSHDQFRPRAFALWLTGVSKSQEIGIEASERNFKEAEDVARGVQTLANQWPYSTIDAC